MTQTKGVDTLAPGSFRRGALFGEFRTASESNSIPYSILPPPHPLCHGLQPKDTESDGEEEEEAWDRGKIPL